jgi:hypothetical protein
MSEKEIKYNGQHLCKDLDIDIVKVKQSLYTPWRHLGGEEV